MNEYKLKLTKKQLAACEALERALKRCQKEGVYLHSWDGEMLIGSNGNKGHQYDEEKFLKDEGKIHRHEVETYSFTVPLDISADLYGAFYGIKINDE